MQEHNKNKIPLDHNEIYVSKSKKEKSHNSKQKNLSRSREKSLDKSNESKIKNFKIIIEEYDKKKKNSNPKRKSLSPRSEKSYDNSNESIKENYNFLSKESDKNRIISFKPLKNFSLLSSEKKRPKEESEETLFSRKKLSIKILDEKKNETNIEEYKFDNTLHQYQKILLSKIVEKINNNEVSFSEVKEEIQKAGVVLTLQEFNEIKKIKDKNKLADITYINYKKTLKNGLEFLLNYQVSDEIDKDVIEFKKILGLEKEFQFNYFVDISEENIYYYNLCLKLYKNAYRILLKYTLYSELIALLKNFFKEKKNLNNLNSNETLYLEILDFYITDKKAMRSKRQKKYIIANLSQNILKENDIKTKVKNLNKYMNDNDETISFRVNDNFLEFIHKETELNFKHKRYETEYHSRFQIDSLTNYFNDIAEKDLTGENLDDEIYKSIAYNKINDNNIFADFIPSLKKAVLHITNSGAMKTFFRETYIKNYGNLQYDFYKKEVIDKFFERIRIIPILEKIDGFSDSYNLKMYLPSNPGVIDNLNYIGEIKVLRFGRYLLLIVHELLGHLMRRYYYYLTNGTIPQNTTEDKKMNFNKEGGYYIEKNLLGRDLTYLSIIDIFSLLINEENIPLIDRDSKLITLSNVEKVIKEYKELFDFIKFSEDDKDPSKLLLKNYYDYLMIPNQGVNKSKMYSHTSYIRI